MPRRILKHSFSLLHVDHVRLNRKWNYVNVISPYIRIYYINEGEGVISAISGKLILEPGYLYIIPSFTLCDLKCTHSLSQYFIHCFEDSPSGLSLFHHCRKPLKLKATGLNIQNIKQLLSINPNRKIYRSDNPVIYEQNIYYREYQELNNQQSDAVFLQTQGILLQLLSQFLALVDFKEGSPSQIPSVILDAIRFIQINLSTDIKVTQLAKRANLQADYFSRIFLKHSGERPLQYIQTRRIERAQYLIATTNLPFSKIAEVTGFQDIHYFFRVFKKLTQMTPREYALKNHIV